MDQVLKKLRQLARQRQFDGLTDRELLAKFAEQADQDAFAELLRRHSSLVLATCRRWLIDEHEAEDACQATFLILAKKAKALPWRESVGAWLHRVAFLVSRKQATTNRARAQREKQVAISEGSFESRPDWRELPRILDEELLQLADKFRAPIVLCCLEELSHAEAASRLGIPEPALRGRLYRGREQLRMRLQKRGIEVGALLAAVLLSMPAALARVNGSFIDSTLAGSALILSGGSLAQTVPVPVVQMVNSGVKMMFLAKLKVIAWTVFVVGAMLTTGAVSAKLIAQPVKNQPQADDPQSSSTKADPTAKSKSRRYKGPEHFGLSGNLVSYDEKTRKITLKLNGQLVPVTLDLDPNCKVTISDDPAKLSELKVGDEMILQLAEDNRTVKAIETNSEDEGGLELVELKLDERTVTLQHGGQTKTHNIRQNALVVLDGFRTELESLEFGMKLTIFFARDKSTITRIFAEWTRDGDLRGRVKLVNPEMTEFEVHHVPNNDEEEVYRVGLGPKTRVFVNGKGGKLDQVKPGMAITVRPDLKDAKLAAVLMAWDDDEPTKE